MNRTRNYRRYKKQLKKKIALSKLIRDGIKNPNSRLVGIHTDIRCICSCWCCKGRQMDGDLSPVELRRFKSDRLEMIMY